MSKLYTPTWVTSYYADDPIGLKIATRRFHEPHSTPAEQEAAREFNRQRATIVRQGDPLYELGFPCTGCKQFAFDQPTLCFWCRRNTQ